MSEHEPIGVKLTAVTKLVEPINKLIDVVSSAVGNLCDPDMIKARAEARAFAKRTDATSQIEIARLQERANDRLLKKQARRQKNIESVTEKAILALPPEAAEEPPTDDWVHQFFDYAQDIADEQMQTFWAKLLAGEVAHPGSYSLLTMASLKKMSKREADLFTEYCTFVWDYHGTLCPILYGHPGLELTTFSHMAILHLQAHGLVALDGVAFPNKDANSTLYYYGHGFELNRGTYIASDGSLTIAGSQLALISGSKPNYDYMRKVLRRYRYALLNPISEEELENFGRESGQ
jgi:hypothetical protein